MGPPPWSASVVALFSTHLFYLRERKALLVAYPSTSATRLWGKWAAQWPQADTTYYRARFALPRLQREMRSSMYVNIPLRPSLPAAKPRPGCGTSGGSSIYLNMNMRNGSAARRMS